MMKKRKKRRKVRIGAVVLLLAVFALIAAIGVTSVRWLLEKTKNRPPKWSVSSGTAGGER